MIDKESARLLVASGEQAVKLPLRMLRACVERAVSLCVDVETEGESVHDRFEKMMQELMDVTQDARLALETLGPPPSATRRETKPNGELTERENYLRNLIKGEPVSLNGRLDLSSKDDAELDAIVQDSLEAIEGAMVEEMGDSTKRYDFVVPANHPQDDLHVAVTRLELVIPPIAIENFEDPSGVYYSVAFGTVNKYF